MTKHTPGPWQTMPRNRTNRQKEPTFDVMTAGNNPENWEMVCDRATEANARLIAAAPDYDKAATEALEWWHGIPSHFHGKEPAWVDNTRKAIAKADGQ